MNGILQLFRRSAAFLLAHPVVWLPVLAVDAANVGVRFALGAVRGPLLLAIAPRSVTGGLSGGVNGPVLFVGGLLTWVPILLQVALFVYGMAVCARWSHHLREHEADRSDGSEERRSAASSRSWRVAPVPTLRTAALTFFVSTVTVGLGTYLTLRGGVPVRWAPLVVECFLVAASWFVMPAWLRLIAEEQGSRNRGWPVLPAFLAMLTGALGAAAAFFLAGEAQPWLLHTSTRSHPVAVTFFANLAGACVASYPLAFSFVALSRYAADRPGVAEQ